MSNFVIISKDAMCTDYLPTYGNKQWHTPNIDALAKQGTVFNRHYTAAPSTVMSFYSMCTGLYAHETNYEMYEKKHTMYDGETIFTKLKQRGFESCHIVWDDMWMVLPEYFDYFRNDVELHPLHDLRQGVGAHYIHDGELKPNDEVAVETYRSVETVVKNILSGTDNTFLWLHLPHVIRGRVSYGSDIELFDKYVGMIRKYVNDNQIAITADHGNMNGHHGKIGYGYDVYESAIKIPLITPRIDGIETWTHITSNIDLYSLLFEKKIIEHDIVYSDSAYRAQGHRKLAIVGEQYKYIYNKSTGNEELYDLSYNADESISIMREKYVDDDRKIAVPLRELYYYPSWDELDSVRSNMRSVKNKVWRNGSLAVVVKSKIKDFIRPFYVLLTKTKN